MFRSVIVLTANEIANASAANESAVDIIMFRQFMKRVEYICERITPSAKFSLSMFEFVENSDFWQMFAVPNDDEETQVFESVLRFNDFAKNYFQHWSETSGMTNLSLIDVIGYPYNINGEGILFVAGKNEVARANLLAELMQQFDSLILDMLLDGSYQTDK